MLWLAGIRPRRRSRLVPCSPGLRPSSPTCPGPAPRSGCTTPRAARWSPPRPDRTARMYVCGITPYDATHLGHAATYLAFDLVNRMWRDAGHAVHYVQNVTDIDDPLLERAERDGEDWVVLADARDGAVPRGHDGAADPAARRLRRRRRVDPADRRPRRGAARRRPRLRARRRHRRHLPRRRAGAGVRRRVGLRRRDHAAAVRRARRRPRPRRQAAAAGPAALARRATGRAVVGRTPRRGRAGRAGTSSAPPSRWTPSAWASTSRAAAATWSSRTTSTPPSTRRRSPATSRSPRPTCTRR